MNDVSVAVDKLISYARKNLGLAKENEICARNAVREHICLFLFSLTVRWLR